MDKFEHGGAVNEISTAVGGKKLVDFSANINPMGLGKMARQAIEENIENIIHYPDVDMITLKTEIAQLYGIDADSIIVGNGAVELLYILCRVLEPKNVLLLAPTFSEYERAAKSVNAKINYFFLRERNDFEPQLQQLIISIKNNNLLFLCNPNNPTGTLFSVQDLTLIIEHAEANGCFVVVDESFMDFISDNEKFSVNPLLKTCHNLLIVHSLTKFFALPGLRLGFAACPDKEVIKRMYLSKDPWNVNCLAQSAGVAALADKTYQRRSRSYMHSEINYLYDELSQIKAIKVYKPIVNYMLINIHNTKMTSTQFCAKMLEHNILVRDCANYPGLSNDFIRIAVKKREENDLLLDAFEQIIK
ncbi:threonine-phosphate decarboxylase CobD [Pectinatus cerevisiiphilus]|uniref:threonine-phosphate decarboxylase n=1 Tax=Pectinatus cerevisiiphilus TaxID=86956 RepID=A0A4R3KFQ8_9FIRM|nr:threonine-phosphate decarboxylase CobD [Pectinatus cerevisiiphilus]TCS81975.1 L-threonine O-3-phosphate decarboxylase [Pectinatus cerevisiiphilus]